MRIYPIFAKTMYELVDQLGIILRKCPIMHQKFEQFVLTEDPSNVRLIPKLELVKMKTEELKDSPKKNHEYYVGFQAC